MSGLLAALLAAVVGASLSALVAYPLGRMQGRQQTIYEEQVKIISELRRLVLKTDEALWWASSRPDSKDLMQKLHRSVSALHRYHGDKRIWLYPAQNAKITTLVEGYRKQANSLLPGFLERSVSEVEEHEAARGVEEWYFSEGRRLIGELEAEAKRLIATDRGPFGSGCLGS